MTTLLERAKGSALEVVIDCHSPPNTITPLLPHARRIKRLKLPLNYWSQIVTLSQLISGPLPLLRTLKISVNESDGPHGQPNTPAAPSPLLFDGAVNLEKFVFEPDSAGSLNNFVFPNLTTFKLSAIAMTDFNASDLFDFLRTSSTLQTVEVMIDWDVVLEDVPRELVVLPNVKTFSLYANGSIQQAYKPALHISCPHATHTSLEQRIFDNHMSYGVEAFPNPVSSKAIFNQYSTGPVEEVTLEIGSYLSLVLKIYSLVFKSSDAAVIRLDVGLEESGGEVEELHMSHQEMNLEIFTQACRTIQSHPLLSHVKRLHIQDRSYYFGPDYGMSVAYVAWELLGSLGPLDVLTIRGLDLRMLFREAGFAGRVFPPVKELTILDERMFDRNLCVDVIVDLMALAESQYKLERPFERVTIYAMDVPAVMAERLRKWVGEVECYKTWI